jgi:hypothetical protein
MMSVRSRALAIGLIGPLICLSGLAWVLLVAALDQAPPTANVRYFLFSSPHLVILVGALVSLACVPLSLTVASATDEEVAIPVFDAGLAEGVANSPDSVDQPLEWSPK